MIMSRLKNIFSYYNRNLIVPRILSYRDHGVLNKNAELKNKYIGKRCFILGGGPSINNLDFNILKNEYTFCVTNFDKHPQFKILNPKFYILSDAIYYTEADRTGKKYSYWPEEFKKKEASIDPGTTLFINLDARNFIEKYRLFTKHNLYYIGIRGIMTDKLPFNIDISKYVPLPKNSILLCLIIAAHMGFDEIYLLGCEHDFLSHRIVSEQGPVIINHGYDDGLSNLNGAEKQKLKNYLPPKYLGTSYEESIAHHLQLFRNYRFFYDKVRQTNPSIHIYNATPNSFLDVFPYKECPDILLKTDK